MTKFVLEIELEDDKSCEICPCVDGEYSCCMAIKHKPELIYDYDSNEKYGFLSRDENCPLIPKEEYLKREKINDE